MPIRSLPGQVRTKAMRMGYVQNGIKTNILEMYDK